MGQPRFLYRGLAICLAAVFGGCGGGTAELLAVADVQAAIYGSGAASSSNYGVTSIDLNERGSISGKVRLAGTPVVPRPIDMGSEKFCISAHAQGLKSEKYVVGPGGELQWVIVYIARGLLPTMKYSPPSEPAILDQIGCRYVPRALVVQVGQPLIIRSSDPITHNIHGLAGANPEFNKGMSTSGSLDPRVFAREEVPYKIKCDVHNWMLAFVGVVPHPCHAVTGADGTFTIRDVPPGSYQLIAWHEELGEKPIDITIGNREAKIQDITFEQK